MFCGPTAKGSVMNLKTQIFSVAVFSLLIGCLSSNDPEEPTFDRSEADDPAELAGPSLHISSMQLAGDHISVDQHNCTCSINDEQLNLDLEDLETGRPYVALPNGFNVYCDPLKEYANSWALHCQFFNNFGSPMFDELFDFYLDRLRWDEKEYIGWFFWTVDGGEGFWCTHTFRITDIDPVYVWR